MIKNTQQKRRDEDMKLKLALMALSLLGVLAFVTVPVTAPPPNMDEGSPWTWQPTKGNARFVELQNKDYSWAEIIGDGRWGWIVYGFVMDGGNFKGSIEVKGMDANSWYLVTLYSDDSATGALLGSVGYYGKVTKPNWADIALFRTDAEGNAKIDLPYTSPAWDPGFGTLTAPTLPAGSYTGVTVAVKYVGTGATPDWLLVIRGGFWGYPWQQSEYPGKYAQDYNIYEMAQLAFTIS